MTWRLNGKKARKEKTWAYWFCTFQELIAAHTLRFDFCSISAKSSIHGTTMTSKIHDAHFAFNDELEVSMRSLSIQYVNIASDPFIAFQL